MPTLRRRRFAASAALAGVLLLAGCAAPPQRPNFPTPRFDDRAAIPLDVAELRVEQSYELPMEPPNVEHLMPVSPGAAARQWARDRLRSAGDTGTATFAIVDASVREVPLETKGGVSGWFTTEPSERYEARLEVRLTVDRPDASGKLRVKAERATSVQEGASLNERELVWYEMVNKLLDDFDSQIEASLNQSFGQFVRK